MGVIIGIKTREVYISREMSCDSTLGVWQMLYSLSKVKGFCFRPDPLRFTERTAES